ncbi:hypothetical protein [Flavobacterium lacus]|uniref:Uncharacterized protein n=1 Tax=Flavobacterium lacus TaxID=1353778 RepID=A0A328WUY9_9FLAO|nr:hypothetical protein [Flavobacterium lacus]RAR46679.1 hypothetical protein B0I10_11683 [Flavobacterium lacus]
MDKNLNFKLIDGTFKPSDAKSVLTTLVKDKIKFHELELFSAHERFGIELPHSKKRIAELNEILLQISQVLKDYESEEVEIRISGTIEVLAVEKKEKNEVF